MRTGHFYLKTTIVTFLMVVIVGYTLYQSRKIWSGTELVITEPKNGSTLHLPLVNIAGKATNASRLTLNDRQIFTDEAGVFNEKMLLSNGYNVFKIKLEDKFNRVKTEILELVYIPQLDSPTPVVKNATTTQESASSTKASLVQ